MLHALLNGLVQGSIYAVVALGYTMVYGILMLINFAHGEVLMIGAYTAVVTLTGLAGEGTLARAGLMPCLGLSLVAAMIVSALYGFSVERIAYRPLRRAPPLSPLISAIGVSIVLQNFVMLSQPGRTSPIYPPSNAPAYRDALGAHGWDFLGATATPLDAFIVGICVVLMVGLRLFVKRTRFGTAMRATSQDKTMAGLVGIDVNRVISATFVIGSALAAVAGLLLALYTPPAKFDMGFTAGQKAFTAAVLGGIGNVPGAMLGGIVLGLAENLGIEAFGAQYKDQYAFVVLLVVLIVRPKGLLGERVAEKV